MSMKTCKQCGVLKSLEEFYAHPKTRDGRQGKCKTCKIAYVQAKYKRKRPVCPPGYRLCPHCKVVKLAEEFGENVSRAPKRGGTSGRQVYCKVCWPIYQRKWRGGATARFIKAARMRRLVATPVGEQKHRARLLTSLAIRFGYLIRQPCEITGCA